MQIAKSRINAEGKITIPAEVRRRLDLRPGTEIVWELSDDGGMRVRVIRTHKDQDFTSFFESSTAPATENGDNPAKQQDFWLYYWKKFGPAQD